MASKLKTDSSVAIVGCFDGSAGQLESWLVDVPGLRIAWFFVNMKRARIVLLIMIERTKKHSLWDFGMVFGSKHKK